MLSSQISRFELTIVLILMVAHLVVVAVPAETFLRRFSTDDAFSYFKVAQNICESRGITFDGLVTCVGYITYPSRVE